MEPNEKRKYNYMGPPRAGRNTPLVDRLARRAARQPNGCLEFIGARMPPPHLPYGTILVDGKTWRVHVLAWVLVNGPVPAGHVIRHTCDNPPCFEVSHLVVGTHKDNSRDRDTRGRAVPPPSRRLFTSAQVDSIRARLAAGERQADLAREYGVDKSTVSHIWRRVSYP
jgi:hypothetical protein